MNLKHMLLAATATALAAPAALAQNGDPYVRPYWWDKPVVEGLGRALVEVAPNRARFDLAFVETDAKSDEAMRKAVARSKIAYDALKKVAGDKSRITTSVTVEAYYKQYRDKDGNMQTNYRPDQVDGYQARVTMVVVLTDPALAGRARAAALALGPQDVNPISIYLEQTPELQRRAAELSRQYPGQDRMLGLLADREAWIARDVAQGVFDAGLLFEVMAPTGQMSPATQQLWRGTMRHYPGRFNGWHRPEDFELFRVGELLACEGAFDSAATSAVTTPGQRPVRGNSGSA